MESVYQLCFYIFSNNQRQFHHNFTQLSMLMIKSLSILSLNIHFLIGSGLNISYWHSYSNFWNAMSMLSLDFLAIRFKFEHELLISIIVLISSIFIIAIIALSLAKTSTEIPSLLILFFRLIIEVTCEYLFIPICVIFLLVFKYSEKSREFEDYPDLQIGYFWEFGNSSKVVSVLFLNFLIIFTLCYETCNYNIRFENVDKFSKARVDCKVNIIMKLIYFIQAVLYVTIGNMYKKLYSIVVTILYIIVFGMYLHNLPYYAFLMNLLQIFIHLYCACLGGFLLISLLLDSATVLFTLAIFMMPIIAYISYELLKYRISLIKPLSQMIEYTFKNFEISIRNHLQKGDLKEKLLTKLNKNYSFNKNKLNIIIQAYYANDILKNPTLALNKIFYITNTGYNFFDNFQVYKCRRILEKICEESSETFRFFQYFLNFTSAKVADKKFCITYSNLLNYVCYEDIRMGKAKQEISNLVKTMKSLIKIYSSLIVRYPDSEELKDMYGLLLLKILSDRNQGRRVLGKLSKIYRNFSMKIMKTNYSFENTRCFLIVSGNQQTLGKVLYFDKNFLSFFSYPEEIALTLNLNSLIPYIFTKFHDSLLLNFLSKCTSHIIFQKSLLYMLDSQGFLFECIVSVECLGFNDSVNFVCAIDVLGPRKREFALLSLEGFIYGHSQCFCQTLEIPNKNISEKYLQEFTTLIPIQQMIPNNIIKINSKSGIIGSILKERKLGSTTMIILYISTCPKEIESWADTSSFYMKIEKTSNNEQEISPVKETVFIKDLPQNTNSSNGKTEDIFVTKKQNNPSYIQSLLLKSELNASQKTIKSLKITRILLLLSILSIIVCNIAIISYIGKEVEHSNSLTALNNLNHLSFLLSQCAIIMRNFDLSFKTQRNALYTEEEFYNIIDELKKIQKHVLDDYNTWAYCECSEVIKKDVVIYWKIEKGFSVKYANLYKVVEYIIENAKIAYNNMLSGSGYNKTLINVIDNAYGPAFTKIKKTTHELISCENSRVKALFSKNIYFIIAGLGILCFSTIFITVLLFKIDKYLNTIWDILIEKLRKNYPQLKSNLNDRLTNFHNLNANTESNEHLHKKNFTGIKYKHSLRYFIRLSILFIIVGIFYLVNSFYFYTKIEKGLIFRPTFTISISNRRLYLSEIQYWTTELYYFSSNYSLQSEFPIFYPYPYPEKSLLDVFSQLTESKKIFYNPLIKSILSNELYDYIYVNIPSSSTFFSTGTSNAIRYIIQESLNIVYSGESKYEDLEKLINNVKEYCNFTLRFRYLPDDDSKKYIDNIVMEMIYFTTGFCLSLLVLYWGFYWPYFTREINVMKNTIRILLKLPKN
ncbi:hypothetical protein SteCoe_6646 [Stentor coeruleus]|uniref:Uncharacterized protein n=1 Tax=Stentor coeruleus TaxID=5963 RepID=A0A1R2CPE9_9CILI|nr:hypothetical protein SteCoe_6646 [Stentor coeruleus]